MVIIPAVFYSDSAGLIQFLPIGPNGRFGAKALRSPPESAMLCLVIRNGSTS